jgi:hypothetical protein
MGEVQAAGRTLGLDEVLPLEIRHIEDIAAAAKSTATSVAPPAVDLRRHSKRCMWQPGLPRRSGFDPVDFRGRTSCVRVHKVGLA